MKQIRFSRAAFRDQEEIDLYTIENFGLNQARELALSFAQKVDLILETPLIGSLRPELDPPGFSFRYTPVDGTPFLIVYTLKQDAIYVARILHGARDIPGELETDSGQ